MARVLVVDDDASLRRILEYNLAQEGYAVATAASGEEALERLEKASFDLVVTDIKMPGMDGMDLLRRIKAESPETQVIVITAFGTIEMAVEAMKAGAAEYITKPFNRDELKLAVRKALRIRNLEAENVRLRQEVRRSEGVDRIVGDSPAMQAVYRLIEKVADSDASVLITGESGTGKELVARAIHRQSRRADRPFVAVNCAAIPRELLESELFGHRKGAFTGAIRDKKGRFEEAAGGTIFLDEIGEMPLDLQPKILRALQEREITPVGSNEVIRVDARVVAATNRDLEAEIEEGRFREDLYYRLAVVPIHMPSLRERPEDVPLLVAHFLKKLAPGKTIRVTPEALEALQRYPWKGNVRELENTIERLLVLRDSDTIELEDLPEKIRAPDQDPGQAGGFSFTLPPEGISLEEVERAVIEEALRRTGWNQSRAARLLRIPRHILLYRMEKFGVPRRKAG
ncbi:sigma-54-dependent transcriptional regulator [Deferrisoma camini]|uniref:sigma-54-dependent transcriptional regulator n=1 Tax=Deferrisoma camini TaxID=1035120 RepID=UPI00046D8F51|nr:sigma-54 dependent transcriptional regulator [Deferrisoma camini]